MARQQAGSQATAAHMNTGSFFWMYVQLADQWSGCDWPTSFGSGCLNLKGLRAAQATLLAAATPGSEAVEWLEAAEWLSQVEQDAKQAAAKAARAAEVAEAGNLAEALRLVEEACAIEGHYHAQLVWQPLREAIIAGLRGQQSGRRDQGQTEAGSQQD
jgi:hypothetical protein